MSEIINRLRVSREDRVRELRAILEAASIEGRDLNIKESEDFARINGEIDRLDERLKEVNGQNDRAAQADAAFNRLGVGGRQPLSRADEDVAAAFRSALVSKNPAPIDVFTEHPRTYSQPGLEQRDTLKSTATQALRTDVYGTIMQRLVENSAVMAAGATVLTTATGEDLVVPKETAWVSSALTAEGASITESDPTLAVATLKSYKYASFFEISQELANDSPADLLDFLADQAAQSLALAYGPHLITGTGSGQPQGIVTAASVGKTGRPVPPRAWAASRPPGKGRTFSTISSGHWLSRMCVSHQPRSF